MSARVFYTLIEKAGDDGPYQTTSLVFWCMMYLNIGATSFYNPYLFSTGNFDCTELGLDAKECTSFVCSLPS